MSFENGFRAEWLGAFDTEDDVLARKDPELRVAVLESVLVLG